MTTPLRREPVPTPPRRPGFPPSFLLIIRLVYYTPAKRDDTRTVSE